MHKLIYTIFFRFIDFYTLQSNNFTLDSNNVTYHHSRLMGASDIENAVSFFCHNWLKKLKLNKF